MQPPPPQNKKKKTIELCLKIAQVRCVGGKVSLGVYGAFWDQGSLFGQPHTLRTKDRLFVSTSPRDCNKSLQMPR